MLERIAASGVLVIAAFIFFILFVALLFLMERKPKKPPVRLRVIRCGKTDRAA